MIGRLLLDWQRLLGRLGCTGHPLVAATGESVLARWSEPHRRYHTVDHLSDVLSSVEALGGGDAERLAAWYHDAVYDPRRIDNEERSAGVATEDLRRLGLDPAETVRLVLLTANHRPTGGDLAGAVLCDADLTILAAAPAKYDRYAAAVRAEYAHLDDGAWASGRAALLRGLLGRPRLYATARGRECEHPARENLRRELAALDSAGDGRVSAAGASDGAGPRL